MNFTSLLVSWALSRLSEATTWGGLLAAIAGKYGLTFAPQFDTLFVNAALIAVALVSYVVKGGPVIMGKKP